MMKMQRLQPQIQRLRDKLNFRIDPGTLINRPLEDRIEALVEHYRAM